MDRAVGWRTGDRQAAFAEIVRRYRQPMFRLSRAFLGDADEALDVTQEAFVAAHQALSRYDPNRSMQAWLTTIAVNKCRDWARKRAVRRFLSFALPNDEQVQSIVDEQVPIGRNSTARRAPSRPCRLT